MLESSTTQHPLPLRDQSRRGSERLDPQSLSKARLSYTRPLDSDGLLDFLGRRAVAGVEEMTDGGYRRSLRMAHGAGVVELWPAEDHIEARFWLEESRDRGQAVDSVRALLDLDADPQAVLDALGSDELIGELVRARPGLRVPGSVDPHELAMRAVLGQQVSVVGAATLAARLVADYGETLHRPVGGVSHLFPSAAALAEADPERLGMPRSRARALKAIASALASGELVLDPEIDHHEVRRQLLALPGIGPWTADYIALRALSDRDAFLPTDLGLRRALEKLGQDASPGAATELAERWRPYRAYAFQQLLAVNMSV